MVFKNFIFSLKDNDLVKRPQLASLYVKSAYRGLGIAQKLIHSLVEVSESRGHKQLYLRPETAAQYYRKLGWHWVEKILDEGKGIETEVFCRFD